jgi:hypothetical protein
MAEEIGSSVFNRLRRYQSGQFGMIRACSALKLRNHLGSRFSKRTSGLYYAM